MKCTICTRDFNNLEYHHFEPGKKRRKTGEGIEVCTQCGDQIHLLHTNNELRTLYNTLDKLLGSPKIQKYIEWVKNKPIDKIYTTKEKKKRKRK